MSVLTIGGQRFAAGLDWQRELVKGRAAGRIAKERYRPWTVDVGEQTGFVNGVDNPEGSRPLAAVLIAGLGSAESWAAFVEEDGKGQGPRRVAVLRGAAGLILPGGDSVFASGEEAFAALGNLQGDRMHLVVTPGLVEFAPDAEVLGADAIAEGAANAPEMERAPPAGMSAGSFVLVLVLMLGTAGGLLWWLAGDDLLRMAGLGQKKTREEPLVEAVVRTGDFLRRCQAAMDERRVSMSGFDRLAVACHPRFAQGVSKMAPAGLAGRPVLEVSWGLREGLDPRVYVPLAQDMLKGWPNAVIDDKGTAAAFKALPLVVERYRAEDATWAEPAEFRRRLDMALALRGFELEYRDWGAEVEVELQTGRPLREAVAMLTAIEGLEVASVTWSPARDWVFAVRRTQAFHIRQSEFRALTRSPTTAAMRSEQGEAG